MTGTGQSSLFVFLLGFLFAARRTRRIIKISSKAVLERNFQISYVTLLGVKKWQFFFRETWNADFICCELWRTNSFSVKREEWSEHQHRASHRYRGGHGIESRCSPDFFQASFFQLFKLEIYSDEHSSLSSTTAIQIWIISYILHIISLHGKIWTQ